MTSKRRIASAHWVDSGDTGPTHSRIPVPHYAPTRRGELSRLLHSPVATNRWRLVSLAAISALSVAILSVLFWSVLTLETQGKSPTLAGVGFPLEPPPVSTVTQTVTTKVTSVTTTTTATPSSTVLTSTVSAPAPTSTVIITSATPSATIYDLYCPEGYTLTDGKCDKPPVVR
ncbi:MAG: hypothetical protein QOH57_3832 [Mycobacterium sp.]|nr:hypothetical protein [Mycobacterium sp.]